MIVACKSGLAYLTCQNVDLGSEEESQAKKKPRLFCDICDCFDLHDTEDCPTQAQGSDEPPHSTYHGSRKEERPYCEICEVFGHWATNCNDDETFWCRRGPGGKKKNFALGVSRTMPHTSIWVYSAVRKKDNCPCLPWPLHNWPIQRAILIFHYKILFILPLLN